MAIDPPFYLQIVDRGGVVVRTHAGGKHEADLIDLLTKTIMEKGRWLDDLQLADHILERILPLAAIRSKAGTL